MTTSTDTIQQLAGEAYACFETARRDQDDPESTFVRVEGSPEWVTDLAREAHGDMFPDDWRYDKIQDALEVIAEADSDDARHDGRHEFADAAVDVYNAARFAWLASNLARPGYCDEAANELGYDRDGGVVGLIGLGQYWEADEIYGLVLQFLERRADEVSDSSD